MRLLENKLLGLLGLAQSASKLTVGEKAQASIRAKQARLVLISDLASQRTQKQILNKCFYYQVAALVIKDFEKIAAAIGRSNIMYLAINDDGFAQAIKEIVNEEVR